MIFPVNYFCVAVLTNTNYLFHYKLIYFKIFDTVLIDFQEVPHVQRFVMDHTYFPVSRFVSSVKETARYATDAREEIGDRTSTALPYCTVLYRTALHCTVPYRTVLYCTVPYCTVLHRIVQQSLKRYYTILYYTISYNRMLCFTIQYYVLSCSVLLDLVFSSPTLFPDFNHLIFIPMILIFSFFFISILLLYTSLLILYKYCSYFIYFFSFLFFSFFYFFCRICS